MQAQNQEITPEFFILPNVNLDKGSQELMTMVNLSKEQLRDRWKTNEGRYILSRWKGNGFDRKILDSLVGKYYDHTDLRGVPLVKENLTKVDLSKVDFYSAILENSKLNFANLSDSWLSESNIRGACFDYAKMPDVLIDNTEFDGKTSFTGVNLKVVDFNLAALLQKHATNQQRIENLKTRYPVAAAFYRITCDYGRSFPRFLLWCLVVILGFGVVYAVLPGSLNKTGLWNGLYFSFMTFVTANSDVQAASVVGKILSVIETGLGYLMAGLLISIFIKQAVGD
ncbi:hypothetical protein WA1_19145 [Scytonema hofmannii PCC 7110]|uniref:Potassium channel domain-containing protein n=1 Tax=Scytonema hofmannii PCC 7110 TaxID=128403 RepID=A0A139XBQ4_9CYAN|nr:pentapeptide repeat-containing protein [Scytonema hofmannii]KYC42115.1 hypothetical protein WA1_19145 [Scytonema hofmannii PCC 7110]